MRGKKNITQCATNLNPPCLHKRASVDHGIDTYRHVLSRARPLRSAEAGAEPHAEVRAANGYEAIVSLVAAPGQSSGVLQAPGSAMVVISSAIAKLEISIRPAGRNPTPQAQFNLELVSGGSSPTPAIEFNRPAPGTQTRTSTSGLRVVAHVSRIGDLSVDEGAWIAGPEAPSPIEAIGVTSLDADLTLTAEFLNTLRPTQWVSCPTSDFIGTRQQASPLLGVRLRLGGAKSDRVRLNAEALFLGSPQVSASGQEIMVVSDTGRDPMIGLRIWLSYTEPVKPHVENKPGGASRVRVFRAN